MARSKFRRASRYAANILKDPGMLAIYSAKVRRGVTPYNLALKDYYTPPKVNMIDVSAYHGIPGEVIRVEAYDEIRLSSVTVTIADAAGGIIEMGSCEPSVQAGLFVYTTTKEVTCCAGCTITALARDTPGNKAALTVPYSPAPERLPMFEILTILKTKIKPQKQIIDNSLNWLSLLTGKTFLYRQTFKNGPLPGLSGQGSRGKL